jgi:hypothetical protein
MGCGKIVILFGVEEISGLWLYILVLHMLLISCLIWWISVTKLEKMNQLFAAGFDRRSVEMWFDPEDKKLYLTTEEAFGALKGRYEEQAKRYQESQQA